MLNKKRVLGRGLGALIGENTGADRPIGQDNIRQRFLLCPDEDISASRVQPRKSFKEAPLNELVESIREKGVIEPLIVRRSDAGLELIAGERRWRAARLAGLREVPVVITDATDQESLEFAIIENIQREDLNAIEEAAAYKALMDFGITQDEVAKRVGKQRATVANYLRLLKLAPPVKDEIQKGEISMGHARALCSIEGHAQQIELLRKILKSGLSVREAEELVGASFKEAGKRKKNFQMRPESEAESELRDIFGTKVTIKEKRTGTGFIAINYFSAEERERIIELLRLTSS